jgi:glutamyl-tRNA reductase
VEAFTIDQLPFYKKGFDVLIVCTSSPEVFVTRELYGSLLNGDEKPKVIIDLSVPSNIHSAVLEENKTDLIDITRLKAIADKNMLERQNEFYAAEEVIEENINAFRHLHRTRRLEVKMKDVPEKIRQIKDKAVNDIFAEDIRGLDEHSKEVLARVLDYMEKKCISVPMIMAKEIILETAN